MDEDSLFVDWKAIFRKSNHEFSEEEIEAASLNDSAVLATTCPKFWDHYKTGERNPHKLEEIWQQEYEWYEAVKKQQFQRAKRLYLKLIKVRI